MKSTLKVIGILFAILIGIILLLTLTMNYFFFSMHHLPKGELLTEVESPEGQYTVRAYLTNGGATVSYAVRGEVIYHEKKNKTKNIYWQYREENADIVWIDDHNVSFNGIELDVRKDVYDYRKIIA